MVETIQNRPASNGVAGWKFVTRRIVRDRLLRINGYTWPKAHVRPTAVVMGDCRSRKLGSG